MPQIAESDRAVADVLSLHAAWLAGADGGVRADLSGADLSGADLSRARLSGADLFGARLSWADLSGARLSGAKLSGADLYGAHLAQTVLDPDAAPNGDATGFQREGDWIVGYRTRKAGHIDQYRDGRIYAADWFSVCDTECHPGLYLWPTLAAASAWAPNHEIIRVRTRSQDVHRAGEKWRCRWFEVLGPAASTEARP